jgi:ring-1,2-phenylacetyl-CoA epoxidase subunit PaaC
MDTKSELYTYCLRLGDDALILGHRLSELCSKAPFLEEDLAITNISLDMIGRAQALFKYASEVGDKIETEDEIAYRRPENKYYNHLITEQPNRNFAHTIVRQFFISVFEFHFFNELTGSKDETLSAIASKTIKEVRYHVEHAADWVIRLGDGTEESHEKVQKALKDLWMYTGELFEMDQVDKVLLSVGITVDKSLLKEKWMKQIVQTLHEATLEVPSDAYMQTGSRKGIHTEHLGHILSEMQYLQRAYPDASW